MWPCALHQIFLALVKKLGTYTTYVNCFQNFPIPSSRSIKKTGNITIPFPHHCRWLAPSWTYFFWAKYENSIRIRMPFLLKNHSPPAMIRQAHPLPPPASPSGESMGILVKKTSSLHDEEYPKSLNPYCSRVPQEDFFSKKTSLSEKDWSHERWAFFWNYWLMQL